jgi:hypothetical protein
MKWAYSFNERSKAALLLAVVLVVVFIASVISKRNVSQLGSSFSSVYEDRLVVESYIYKFSDYLYQKKIIMDQCSGDQLKELSNKIGLHNEAIRSMIASYEKTKLTDTENRYFSDFKMNINAIMEAEDQLVQQDLPAAKLVIDKQVDNALTNLQQLSSIQISEGKILNDNTKKIVAGSEVLTQFEMAVLIVICVLIQVLIFASKSFNPKAPQNHSLN